MKNVFLFILLIITISVTSCKICPEINTSSTVDTSYIIRNAQREVHIQDSVAFEMRVDSLMEIFNRALFQAAQPDVDFTPTTIATKKQGGTTANVKLYRDSLNNLQLTIDLLTDSLYKYQEPDTTNVLHQKDVTVVKVCPTYPKWVHSSMLIVPLLLFAVFGLICLVVIIVGKK